MHVCPASESCSAADPEAAEPALGAGDDPVERVEQIARLRNPVGVARGVVAQRAVDADGGPERCECDDAAAVDLAEVADLMAVPVRHRRTDVLEEGTRRAREAARQS